MKRTAFFILAILIAAPVFASGLSLYPGKTLPPFELGQPDGSRFSSDELKGTPSVIVYVQPEQSRSHELLEDLERLSSGIENLNVVALSATPFEEWTYPFKKYVDPSRSLYEEWRVRVFPVVIFVDAEEIVQASFSGYTRGEHETLSAEFKILTGQITREEWDSSKAEEPVSFETTPTDELMGLGQRHWQDGFPERAKEVWDKVLEKEPDYPNAHLALTRYFLKMGDLPAAIEHVEKPIATNPSEEAWLLAARARLLSEDLKGAEEAAENALDLNRRSFDAKLTLAEVYLAENWLEEAEELVLEVRMMKKDSPRALYLSGRIAEARGDLQEAIKLYREALALQWTDW